MLELVKKHNPYSLLLVILYGFAVRSCVFFMELKAVAFDYDQPMSFLTDNWCVVNRGNLIFHYLFTTILFLIISIFINLYLKNNKIVDRLGYLPTLLFMLVSATFPSFLYFSNELLAFLFFSISFIRLLQALLVEETDVKVFDAAFFMSIASLFYKPILPCFFIVFFAIIILKSVQIKAFIYMAMGLLIPYFLLGVYMFATDRSIENLHRLIPQTIGHFQLFNASDYLQIITLIFMMIISALGFVKVQASLAKRIVSVRKFYSLLLIVSIIYLPLFLINNHLSTAHFIFLILPISYYILNFLKDMKRIWISELIHVALLAFIYLSNLTN